jgi:hypothetical protein
MTISHRFDALRRINSLAKSITHAIADHGLAPACKAISPLPELKLPEPDSRKLENDLAELGVPPKVILQACSSFLKTAQNLRSTTESKLLSCASRGGLAHSSLLDLRATHTSLYNRQLAKWQESAVSAAAVRIAEEKKRLAADAERKAPPVPYQKAKPARPPFNTVSLPPFLIHSS